MSVEEARRLVHEGVTARCDEYHDDGCAVCPPLTDRLILEVQAEMACERIGIEGMVPNTEDANLRRHQHDCGAWWCRSCTARAKLAEQKVPV